MNYYFGFDFALVLVILINFRGDFHLLYKNCLARGEEGQRGAYEQRREEEEKSRIQRKGHYRISPF